MDKNTTASAEVKNRPTRARQGRVGKPLREIAEAGREQCPQPQLRDYTVTGKKCIKQDDIVKKSECKKLGITKAVWYEARNVVFEAFVENDQQQRFMHIQGVASF